MYQLRKVVAKSLVVSASPQQPLYYVITYSVIIKFHIVKMFIWLDLLNLKLNNVNIILLHGSLSRNRTLISQVTGIRITPIQTTNKVTISSQWRLWMFSFCYLITLKTFYFFKLFQTNLLNLEMSQTLIFISIAIYVHSR